MHLLLNTSGILLTGIGLFINAIPKAAPEKVYVYLAPLTQWSCTTREHLEYHGACQHRKWADQRIPSHG